VGGAVGSLARYGLAGAINFRAHPWGTVTVNLIGSLVLGILIGLWGFHVYDSHRIGLAVGLLGGFTTFSSFAIDTIYLWERGDVTLAVETVAATPVFGMAAAIGGIAIGRSLF
jgi:CrcB protein